jgi:cystathionine beta-lyase
MDCNFDRFIDRRGTECAKWRRYGDEVLPLWVADMDFASPEPVIRALRERVEHGIFGYPTEPPELRGVIIERLNRRYGWQVSPESLVFVPGVVTGFNLACQALGNPGEGILFQTPVYGPIIRAARYAQMSCDEMVLTLESDGRYTVDLDRMEAAITPQTRIFLLCNPHNPVGRVFTREELAGMAEICARHDLIICSDEIHCELLFRGSRHTPIATLSPEIESRTITLMAPSKTFNIAGLHCSVAIIPDESLRRRFESGRRGLIGGVTIMGYIAALAAYRDGQPWLDALLCYLEGNRDLTMDYVNNLLPGVRMACPEGTYLAWLDCRDAGIPGNPHEFFLREARVALNDGPDFGRPGEGFVRLNFGCCRDMLTEALERMRSALEAL